MERHVQKFPMRAASATASSQSEASVAAAGRPAASVPSRRLHPLPRPDWLSEGVWPFHTSVTDIEGCKIAITDVGQGPVLLFVHTGFWSFIWRDVILRLAADFRCVCFDAPGTGQSDRLPVPDITLDRAARALSAIIRVLDLTDIGLVFHDLGGPSGIAGAARAPDRIRALCAVNTFGWRPSGAPFRGMLALMGSAAIREFDVLTGILPRITESSFGIGRRMDLASRRAFIAGIGRQGIRSFHAYMRDARHSPIFEEVERALSGPFRQLPCVTVFGERNDPLGFQPRWKRLFPDARQVVVAKGNHFPMCDDPDLLATSIRELYRERVAPTLRSADSSR